MIDVLAKKSSSGEICINKAKLHLSRHEWGLARLALEDGIRKGGLLDQREADRLLREIQRRLWNGAAPTRL